MKELFFSKYTLPLKYFQWECGSASFGYEYVNILWIGCLYIIQYIYSMLRVNQCFWSKSTVKTTLKIHKSKGVSVNPAPGWRYQEKESDGAIATTIALTIKRRRFGGGKCAGMALKCINDTMSNQSASLTTVDI